MKVGVGRWCEKEPLEGNERGDSMSEFIRIAVAAVLDCQGYRQKQRDQPGGSFDNSGKM